MFRSKYAKFSGGSERPQLHFPRFARQNFFPDSRFACGGMSVHKITSSLVIVTTTVVYNIQNTGVLSLRAPLMGKRDKAEQRQIPQELKIIAKCH